MPTRKYIRDVIAAQIASVYSGPIYTSRAPDHRNHTDFVTVMIDLGEAEREGIGVMMRSQLLIGFHHSGSVTDDDLDATMMIIAKAVANGDYQHCLVGINFESFDYKPDNDEPYSSLIYTYTIYYQET